MSAIRDWDKFIDRMLHSHQTSKHERSVSTQDNLAKVVIRMEHYQRELNIPDRAIRIVSYFARNAKAIIIPDANVRQAFHHARRAMNL